MKWDNLLNEANQAKAPSERLIEFVSRRYKPPALFLDIGPGKHAPNQRHLELVGFQVMSVDSARAATKNIEKDICDVIFPPNYFDLVYDVNTLCHVMKPPMDNILSWLKPGGRFFSVAPTDDTWRGVGEGKEFTRFATMETMEKMHDGFTGLRIGRQSYPSGDNQINSWVLEAIK